MKMQANNAKNTPRASQRESMAERCTERLLVRASTSETAEESLVVFVLFSLFGLGFCFVNCPVRMVGRGIDRVELQFIRF